VVTLFAHDFTVFGAGTQVISKAIWFGGPYNWYPGDPEIFDFNVYFYSDNGDCAPGDIFAEYLHVTPIRTDLGWTGGGLPLYRYELDVAVLIYPETRYWVVFQADDHLFPPQWGCQQALGEVVDCESQFRSDYFGYYDWTDASQVFGYDFEGAFILECGDPTGEYACCVGETCQILSFEDCQDIAGIWLPGFDTCDPNPCLFPERACCFEDGTCQVLTAVDCVQAGGTWYAYEETCDPNPCPQPPEYACCLEYGWCVVATVEECEAADGEVYYGYDSCDPNPCPQVEAVCCFEDETCLILTGPECDAAGGTWYPGESTCEPNPCILIERACCLGDGTCLMITEPECQQAGGSWFAYVETCDPDPCVNDLRAGAFIAHHAPSLVFTTDTPEGGWGEALQNSADAITACEDQLNRLDGQAEHLMWFIISAWDGEDKIWCSTQMGIEGYDSGVWLFQDNGPVYPGGGSGLEIYTNNFPHGDPPGGASGVICGPTGGNWGPTNFEPVWWFEGYAYATGTTVIQLGEDPSTAFGGWFNCENPPGDFMASCFGALGVNTDGIYCCPEHVEYEFACCFEDGSCLVATVEICEASGGEVDYFNDECDPNPCPEPEYACCFEDGTCTVATIETCEAADGEVFYDYDSCDPNPCPQPPEYACCFDNGDCEELTEEECDAEGGEVYFDYDSCNPNPCPQPPEYACCFENGECEVLTEEECHAEGGEVYFDYVSCDPNPCPQPERACCFESGECQIATEADCLQAGGSWYAYEYACEPNPCPQPEAVCCLDDDSCQIMTQAECAGAGGTWFSNESSCDPNPCIYVDRACCLGDGTCLMITEPECQEAGGTWFTYVDTCDPDPCVNDLRAGVFIAHYAPSLVFTTDIPEGGWGEVLQNSADAITTCEDQLNRLDGVGNHLMWFIISAWDAGDKIWCSTQMGIEGYDPGVWLFHDNGPVYPGGGPGLEIYTNDFPHGDPPGGASGVICGPTGGNWGPANFEPVWWFEGYAYASGTTVIQLNQDPSTEFGGWFNCQIPPDEFPAACFGAMGVGTDGVYCCPEQATSEFACCFEDGSCTVVAADDCAASGGDVDYSHHECDPNPCPQPEYACCFDDGSCAVATIDTCETAGGEVFYDYEHCDPNPCPQPEAACCFDDASCQIMTEVDCVDAGGSWLADEESCDPNPCLQIERACCFEDGTCEVLNGAECAAAGGTWMSEVPGCAPNPCPQPEYACCFENGSCLVFTAEDCENAGGVVFDEYDSCDPNPCPQPPEYACCFDDGSCEILTELDCSAAGGEAYDDYDSCTPNPCPQPPEAACCFDDSSCQMLNEFECSAAGGIWYPGESVCDPNPCLHPERACCFDGGICQLMTGPDCSAVGGTWLVMEEACDPNPCVHDLNTGVFIAHHAPNLIFTDDTPEGGWGEALQNSEDAIETCEDQINRINGHGSHRMWFIISAWVEDRVWCATDVGIPGYDPATWVFHSNGPVYPGGGDGLEILTGNFPHGDPPGGPSGALFGPAAGAWGPASFEPVWWFEGYAYDYGTTVIELGVDSASGFGGWFNCESPPGEFPAECFGAMGVGTEGVYCCPEYVEPERPCCFEDGACALLTAGDCATAGGFWYPWEQDCDPNPCPQPPEYACCFDDGSCEVFTEAECVAAGGEVHDDFDSCTPNPCPQPERACCFDGGICRLMTAVTCSDFGGTWLGTVESCDPNPCMDDLSYGAFLAHYAPSLVFTTDTPDGGWGEALQDSEDAIDACEDQLNRIDGHGPHMMWFIISAWVEDRVWCATQVGIAGYDPATWAFHDNGPVYPGGGSGLEILTGNFPHGDPPGGPSGVILGPEGGEWGPANFEPIWWFEGYAYDYGTTAIALDVDPSTGFGGWFNCENPPSEFPADCFGAMGVGTDGIYCCPESVPPERACCFEDGACLLLIEAECEAAGGTWYPWAQVCDPNPCVSMLRACCFPDRVCVLMSEYACTTVGGVWYEDVESCDPNPCPHCDYLIDVPNGGEIWAAGETYEILWRTIKHDTEHIGPNTDLLVTLNNGLDWELIAGNVADDGSFMWTIPESYASEACRVRVQRHESPDCLDDSDDLFTIEGVLARDTGPATTTVAVDPSPLSTSSVITFGVPGGLEDARISIYDVTGRRVKLLTVSGTSQSTQLVTWDGRSDRGELLDSGIYFYQLTYRGGRHAPRRIVVLK
jgi:hypothetical protein